MAEDETFLKEALPSRHYREYKQRQHIENECLKQANNAIECKRKLSRCSLDREQRDVTDQLRRMRAQQVMYAKLNKAKSSSNETEDDSPEEECAEAEDAFVNPYPVTITPHRWAQRQRTYSESNEAEEKGMRYARTRGRRQSKEFEDLAINTKTGSLLPAVNGSQQKSDMWAGDPEAIHSVRRQRKSVQEQHRDFIFKRSYTSDCLATRNKTGQSPSLVRKSMDASILQSPSIGRKTSESRTSFDSSPGLHRKLSKSSIDGIVSPTPLVRKLSSTNAHALALGSGVNTFFPDSPNVQRKKNSTEKGLEDGKLWRQGSASKRIGDSQSLQRKSSTGKDPLDESKLDRQGSQNRRTGESPSLHRRKDNDAAEEVRIIRQGSDKRRSVIESSPSLLRRKGSMERSSHVGGSSYNGEGLTNVDTH